MSTLQIDCRHFTLRLPDGGITPEGVEELRRATERLLAEARRTEARQRAERPVAPIAKPWAGLPDAYALAAPVALPPVHLPFGLVDRLVAATGTMFSQQNPKTNPVVVSATLAYLLTRGLEAVLAAPDATAEVAVSA